MAPQAPDNSFDLGWKSGDQADAQRATARRDRSHLEQVLANTRATQQQKSDLDTEKDTVFIPSAGLHPSTAQFGTDRGDGRHSFKNVQLLSHALTQGTAARDRDDKVASQQTLAREILQAGIDRNEPIDSRHPVWPILQEASGKVPMSEKGREELHNFRKAKSAQSPGTRMVDAYGQPTGPAMAFPTQGQEPPVRPGYIRDYTTDGSGKVSYHDKKEKPSLIERSALGSMKEDGWTEDTPGYHTEFANRVQKMTPFTEGGGLAPRASGFNKPPVGPAGTTPPAGVAPAAGQVSGMGAEEGGAQAAAWLRERAKNPYLSPDERQALLKAATAADKVQTAGRAQAGAADQPAGPQTGLVKGPGGVLLAPNKPADPAQTKLGQEADTALAGITQIRKYFDDPEVKTFRGENGAWPQIKMRGQALAQDKLGIATGLPKNVQAIRAALIGSVAAYRRSTSGVNVTENETKFLTNLLASDASDPAFETKLAEFERLVQGVRQGINVDVAANRRQAIPRAEPGPDKTPPSTKSQPPVKPSGGEEMISVTRTSDGQLGQIPAKNFDPARYRRR